MNLYSYVVNDPTNFIDPYGLRGVSFWDTPGGRILGPEINKYIDIARDSFNRTKNRISTPFRKIGGFHNEIHNSAKELGRGIGRSPGWGHEWMVPFEVMAIGVGTYQLGAAAIGEGTVLGVAGLPFLLLGAEFVWLGWDIFLGMGEGAREKKEGMCELQSNQE